MVNKGNIKKKCAKYYTTTYLCLITLSNLNNAVVLLLLSCIFARHEKPAGTYISYHSKPVLRCRLYG